MYIDKFKKEDGYYDYENHDCFYEDAETFLQSRVLGFVGVECLILL